MKIEMIPINEIREYERNPRENTVAIPAVAKSISEFGFKVPVIVDADNVLIAGHTRVRAAVTLGMTEVPAIRATDLTPEQVKAFRVADNKLHELSGWNFELLQTELAELKALDVDLGTLGFDQDELAKIFDPGVQPGLTDPDLIPLPPDEAITQLGDLWILGDHRLLCGDSASGADVNRLLAVDSTKYHDSNATAIPNCDILPIHLVNSDPPYNVKVEPRSNNAIAAGMSSFGDHGLMHHQSFDLHRAQKRTASRYHQLDVSTGAQSGKPTHKKLRPKDRPLANDFVSDEQFEEMLHAWFGNIARVLLPGRCFYLWGGWVNCANYPPVLKAKGLYFAQSIIWVKEHPVLTRKDFMGNHEWCFYGLARRGCPCLSWTQ